MATHYALPTPDDFARLSEPRSLAVSLYVETSPVVAGREGSATAAKSAFDRALDAVKAAGASPLDRAQLVARWEEIARDRELWGNLAASLAIFLAPDLSDVYVLPNRLENQAQVAGYFDVGQLLRSVTFPQEAYAVLLAADGWSLWHATATQRAHRVELSARHPANFDEATNRDVAAERSQPRRMIGDEAHKTLLETYAKRVSDAVTAELGVRDPGATDVIFVFAAEPLQSMFAARGVHGRVLLPVPGAPGRLGPASIDQAMRARLSEWNSQGAQQRVDAIADADGAGLAATQLSTIARAAVSGAVDTLVFAFPVDINGRLDDATGTISFAPGNGTTMPDGTAAYDLLSRIAVAVLRTGGSVIAVRPDEVSSRVWNGQAVAHLRYALARA